MSDATHRYTLALEIGEEAIRQGKWQQALTCFQTALTGLPREPRVYNGLGDTHLSLADRGRALACYKEAARLAGDNADYVNKVAEVQESLGMIPDAARSHLISGDIYWSHSRFDRAEAQWAQAVHLQGNLIAARERLALADILRRDGRCLMALHICYTVMNDIPDAQPLWSAVDQAWRCAIGAKTWRQRALNPGIC